MDVTTNDNRSVLVPAGSHEATCQCVRSLGRRGIRTVGASDDASVPAFASKYCEEVVSVPSPDDFPAYRDALLELAARRDVATIVPCCEVDAYLLSRHREAFEEHVSLVVPSPDELKSVHDRVRLVEAAEEAGVPVPETRVLDEVTDWSDRLIVKSRYNLLTSEYVDSHPPRTPEEVTTVAHLEPGERPDCAALREEMKHVPIVQEFVPKGDEYMFAALYDHGEPLATYQHRQIRGDSYVGGGGVYRKSVFVEELEDVARTLLGHLDWHGLACIEYIEDATTGEFKLVEINPRMWQSLPSTVRAGADFPYYYWLGATGRAEQIEPGYETGVGCHKLNGELGYLLSILTDDSPHVERPTIRSSLWEILRSCVEQPNFDYLHLDDPRPFASGLRKFLSSK